MHTPRPSLGFEILLQIAVCFPRVWAGLIGSLDATNVPKGMSLSDPGGSRGISRCSSTVDGGIVKESHDKGRGVRSEGWVAMLVSVQRIHLES